jgi:putative FmdB family regulatory protein
VPVYEYRCEACGKKFSALVGMTAEPDNEACPHCGSPGARRLVSRFARGRDEDARMEEIADRMDLMGEPNSPAAMRDMAREIGKAMDEDVADEMEEMLDEDFSSEDGIDE